MVLHRDAAARSEPKPSAMREIASRTPLKSLSAGGNPHRGCTGMLPALRRERRVHKKINWTDPNCVPGTRLLSCPEIVAKRPSVRGLHRVRVRGVELVPPTGVSGEPNHVFRACLLPSCFSRGLLSRASADGRLKLDVFPAPAGPAYLLPNCSTATSASQQTKPSKMPARLSPDRNRSAFFKMATRPSAQRHRCTMLMGNISRNERQIVANARASECATSPSKQGRTKWFPLTHSRQPLFSD